MEITVPVTFNSVVLFRPANVVHRVREVTAQAGQHRRHTLTAFYCYTPSGS
jgi:hypothetical protein